MTPAFDRSHRAAFRDYGDTLRGLVAGYPEARILELGGGRNPSFTLDQMPPNVASYTVNDISAAELARAPDGYDTACFDVIGDVSAFAGRYDVVFSRTLIEHVRDGVAMHRNVLRLLRPGGVAFHMAPTLWSLPFVVNKLLPETLSSEVLYALFPNRRQRKAKFPAYYDWCYGSRTRMERMLRGVGFGEVAIRSFYGHGYYDRVPGLRTLAAAGAAIAARRDWSALGSYAHITAWR